MSISSVFLTGLSGLRAAQTGLQVTSQNITNANTPGYVRANVNLSPLAQLSGGGGVDVASIQRAADRFLAAASYLANGAQGAASARSDILARAQASFGDPTSDTGVFSSLDQFWSALTEIGVDPSSALRRADAIGALQSTFAEVKRVGGDIQSLIGEADQRIGDAISNAQGLIDQIADLNKQIQLTKRTGADTTSAENAQSALVDQLSQIMDVSVTPQDSGGIHVRTRAGALLVGVNPATLHYSPDSSQFSNHAVITIDQGGSQTNLEQSLTGGSLAGLIQVRDQDLAGLADALGGFSGALADALNEVHNDNASSPPVGNMVGRNTGLVGGDGLNFTGKAIVGITDVNGTLKNRLTIDFDAKTITGEAPAATYSFSGGTIADLTAALNSALGASAPAGTATFANGSLKLNVGGGGGIVIQQDGADPSDRAGRGFSHFFGLNDVVSRPTPLFFENGVDIMDKHGFNAGGQLTYSVRDSAGRQVATRTVTISGALAAPTATWNDLISQLNAPGSGLGEFGAFAMDPATGKVSFTPGASYQVDLVGDTTTRGDTGISFTALNGLSKASTAGRALEVDVNTQVANDPSRLAIGKPDMTVDIGDRLIEEGDNRGATALLGARDSTRSFDAAGVLTAQSTSLGIYAARLGGEAGRLASDAQRGADGATAVATAANDRRSDVEGVNLDDELMKMTTYQNAYAASARVIQAATDMLDVLMSIGYRN